VSSLCLYIKHVRARARTIGYFQTVGNCRCFYDDRVPCTTAGNRIAPLYIRFPTVAVCNAVITVEHRFLMFLFGGRISKISLSEMIFALCATPSTPRQNARKELQPTGIDFEYAIEIGISNTRTLSQLTNENREYVIWLCYLSGLKPKRIYSFPKLISFIDTPFNLSITSIYTRFTELHAIIPKDLNIENTLLN